jgi:hypothetical protein
MQFLLDRGMEMANFAILPAAIVEIMPMYTMVMSGRAWVWAAIFVGEGL